MANLTGIVTDADGKIVSDATVSALNEEGLKGQDDTGADGKYLIKQLSQGKTYQLRVMVGDAEREVGSVTIEMNNPTTTHNIDLGATSETTTTSATTQTSLTTGTTDTSVSTASSSSSSDTTSSSTSSDTTSSSTSSDTTSSSTTSSDTTSSSTSTDSTSSSTTSTTVTSATTATTATTVTLAPDPDFEALETLISSTDFAITPAVNLEEARQSRNLFRVGNYLLARVPESITRLDAVLTSNSNNGNGRLNLVNKADLIQNYNDKIQDIVRKRAERFSADQTYEERVLQEVRRQFNLGTTPAAEINRDFPGLYRQFISLCADDLMGVTPDQLENQAVFDATQRERLFNFLRRLKAALISLTESLSFAGTLGTQSLVHRQSIILKDALDIINNVGQRYVASDDIDQKHWVNVLSSLINVPSGDVKPYLVHAREGAQLLAEVILAYDKIRQSDGLEKEDEAFLRSFFYTKSNVFPNQTIVEKLKEDARLLLENFPANWS